MSELGNLSAGILLSPQRMSTVKIRARSLFCTPLSRNGPSGAGFETEDHVENVAERLLVSGNQGRSGFPLFSTGPTAPAQLVHKYLELRTCGKMAFRCKVEYRISKM